MKGLLNDDTLKDLILVRRPIDALTETDQFWLAGTLRLMKRRPHFHYGFGGTLTNDSLFRKQRFHYPEASAEGFALILLGFIHPSGEPEEFFAGWVPPEAEAEMDRWIAFLNRQIRLRLAGVGYDDDPERLPPSMNALAGASPSPSPASHAPAPGSLAAPRRGVAAAPLGSSDQAGQHHASLEVVRKHGLVPVGFFRELGNSKPNAPSLVEARGRRAAAHKSEVLAYLRGGELVFAWMAGGDEDFFRPGTFLGPEHICGDGVYAWPLVLAAYVELYDVELPREFEEHMQLRNWRHLDWSPS
jgi:hypothetical protein